MQTERTTWRTSKVPVKHGASFVDRLANNTDPDVALQIPVEKPRMSQFAFVNTSGPPIKDAKTKSFVKRHIKLNLDRIRRGQTPIKTPLKNQIAVQALSESVARTLASGVGVPTVDHWQGMGAIVLSDGYTESISRFSSRRTDPFIKYPVDLTHETGALLDHGQCVVIHVLFGIMLTLITVFDHSFDFMKPYREAFFPVGLLDPASFYQVLSNFTWLVRAIGPKRDDWLNKYVNEEIALNYSRAMRIVKARLSDPGAAASEGTIAAIVSMACYAVYLHNNPI